MAAVVLENVTRSHSAAPHAVKNLTLHVADREFVVMVGPSGCGKSTTLRLIAGLEDVSSGVIKIGGRDVTCVPTRDRDVAMVFQNYALYPHMSVYGNLVFGLRLRKLPQSEIDRRVRETAGILELGPLLERRPAELSGGQRQRVAMGRALVREPAVFLMDEPLSNLDATLRAALRGQIAALHRRLGATTVYVTHDQAEAMTLADRIVVMRGGEIMQVDTPMNLYDFPSSRFVAGFLGSPAMNFLEARVQGGAFVLGEGRVVPVGPLAESLRAYEGLEVSLGVRPEHICVAGRGEPRGPNALRGQVVRVEPLGASTDLLVHVAGQSVAEQDKTGPLAVVKVDGHSPARPGDMLDLRVDGTRLHAFDTVTGAALDRGKPTGGRGQTP